MVNLNLYNIIVQWTSREKKIEHSDSNIILPEQSKLWSNAILVTLQATKTFINPGLLWTHLLIAKLVFLRQLRFENLKTTDRLKIFMLKGHSQSYLGVYYLSTLRVILR